MATPFWHKPKHILYSTLLLSLSLALAGCMGEDSKAKRSDDGAIVVNKIADITNESKDNYDDNVNGLITHNTLKKWIDNWEANRPAGVSGKLVILQQAQGPVGAEFIKPNNTNVFTYAESGWLEPRNNGVMNIGEIVLSGPSIDRVIRKYGIDVNNDMIVCAQGGGANGTGNYMNQGRCWFTFSYWGVPQQRIALLNGNNTYLSDSAQLGSTYFTDTASPIISRQISSVKNLKVDNTVLYASIEDVINVLPLTDAPDNNDGLLLWDARNLPQYSAGQHKWNNNSIESTIANGISGFQNSSTRQSHPRGALNLEFTNLLDVSTGLYHSKSILKGMVRGGVSPKGEAFVSGLNETYQPVGLGNAYQDGDIAIHYCETSMRAGVTIIAAAVILGIPSRLYDSAMIEWNSLTAGASDTRGFTILPSNSPWDTSALSQPFPIEAGASVAPRTALGWAPEKTRQSITDAIFKKAEADKGAPLSTPEKQALTAHLAGLSDQDIQAEADADNLSYQEFDATEIAKNLAASPMVSNAFAEKVNLVPLADQAYKAPKKVAEDDTGASQGGGVIIPPNACGG